VAAVPSSLDAPPQRIAPRRRASGRHLRRGRPTDVIDRSDAKALLAAAAAEEARQIVAARRRLATGARARLSDLGTLDPAEFTLFLDLLGDALSVRIGVEEAVEVTSSDGTMRVRLEPTADGRTATIDTPAGRFSGPDHHVTIEDLVAPSLVR
jgi:uncharacterized protein (TIGR02677 family)